MEEHLREIRLTHLSDVFSRTTKINECYINKIRAVTDSHRLLLERILWSHRYDLSQLKILWCEINKK